MRLGHNEHNFPFSLSVPRTEPLVSGIKFVIKNDLSWRDAEKAHVIQASASPPASSSICGDRVLILGLKLHQDKTKCDLPATAGQVSVDPRLTA